MDWWGDRRLGIRPGGVCSSGCHVEGGGGDLLGVVGFRFDAQDGGMDELELSDERKVDFDRSDYGARSGAKQARDEGCKVGDHVNGVVGGVGGGWASEFWLRLAAVSFSCRVVHGGVGGWGRSN